ncbi:MAG: hypothetical protein IPQ07_27020 [Myxococcales bacterium]|nr:hypothetical protein [Myxococcales bacterium]
MRRWWCAALVLAGCGRQNFDPLRDGDVGGTDAADALDAADAAAACTTFCDNFDRTTPPQTGWDIKTTSGAGTSVIANGQLQITLPATGDGTFLVTTLPAATSRVRIAFKIAYTSTAPGIAEVDLVQLRWDLPLAGCTSEGFYLVRDSTGPFDLQETYAGCGANVNTAFVDLANSGLHAVVMTITLGALNTAKIEVAIDNGTPPPSWPHMRSRRRRCRSASARARCATSPRRGRSATTT